MSWHGLAMWVTTPVLFYLPWPRMRGRLHRALWITVACVAIPDLLYQNSGWVQFGYRFSLDGGPALVPIRVLGFCGSVSFIIFAMPSNPPARSVLGSNGSEPTSSS